MERILSHVCVCVFVCVCLCLRAFLFIAKLPCLSVQVWIRCGLQLSCFIPQIGSIALALLFCPTCLWPTLIKYTIKGNSILICGAASGQGYMGFKQGKRKLGIGTIAGIKCYESNWERKIFGSFIFRKNYAFYIYA